MVLLLIYRAADSQVCIFYVGKKKKTKRNSSNNQILNNKMIKPMISE